MSARKGSKGSLNKEVRRRTHALRIPSSHSPRHGRCRARARRQHVRRLSCTQAIHRDKISANTVTKEFLLFSQPFIYEGALLSSSTSGRRFYVHHLSDVPLSEVFTTREGNHLQRIDKVRARALGRRVRHAARRLRRHWALSTAHALEDAAVAILL